MNFNLLFTLLSTLSFELYFDVTPNQKQDFFIFEGKNNSAHFFRKNQTLLLYLNQNDSYAIYHHLNNDNTFSFSWTDFKVNGVEMKLLKSTGNITNMEFDGYTFQSSVTLSEEICETDIEPIFQMNQTNYIYILLIVLGGGLLMKMDRVSVILHKLIITLLKDLNPDDDYVEMENIQTQ